MEQKLFDILKERGYVKDLTHEQEIIDFLNSKIIKNQDSFVCERLSLCDAGSIRNALQSEWRKFQWLNP